MKKIKTLTVICILAIAGSLNAQKIVQGDKTLAFLKGETKLNVDCDYAGFVIGKQAKSEEIYLEEMLAKLNDKKAGKGDRWVEKWRNDKGQYGPVFETALNLELSKINVAAAKDTKDAKYTIRVKLLVIEPGSDGSVKVNPSCKFEISWLETGSGNVMAKGTLIATSFDLSGNEKEYDQSKFIKECFSKCGKEVGLGMAKKMK